MKANEFIKQFGYNKANYIWRNYTPESVISMGDGEVINTFELGKLLESKELIKKVGGMKRLKKKLHKYQDEAFKQRLKQAIEDVESCL